MKPISEKAVADFIKPKVKIVIAQADNPDGDSLGSALALEQILHAMGKEPVLYCGVDMPGYLHYMAGWDRVVKDLPSQFDGSIIVDTSAANLLENLQKSGQFGWLAAKPALIIDHHDTAPTIDFTKLAYIKPAVATAQLIYELAQANKWKLNKTAMEMLAWAILSDSMGLSSEAVTARSIHILGELVEGGVSLASLEQRRREYSQKTPEILGYKGRLLQRIEYYGDGKIAVVTIPWEEIEKYSHEYNPAVLVLEEMRSVKDVAISIAFKLYKDGKITAKIRTNFGYGVAGELAESFGGGGHIYASGFKITDGRGIEEIKSRAIEKAEQLLNKALGVSKK